MAIRALVRRDANVSGAESCHHSGLVLARQNGTEFSGGREQRLCLGVCGSYEDDGREPEWWGDRFDTCVM